MAMISGVKTIDKKIGPLIKNTITTIYGPPASGKTTLCFLYLINCLQDGKKVVFIDTEGGFCPERILQLNKNANLKSIIVSKPTNFGAQTKIIKKLNNHISKDIGLVIIDSLVMLYRLKLGDEVRKVNLELAEQLMTLNEIARTKNIPILITNQVYTNFETKKIQMVGGSTIEYWSKVILRIEKNGDVHSLYLDKHKFKKRTKILDFTIVEKGLEKSRSFFF